MLSSPHVTTGARDVVTSGWGGVRRPFAPWRIARCAFGNPVRFPLGMQARRSSLLVLQGRRWRDARRARLLRFSARFARSVHGISRSAPVYGPRCSFRRAMPRRTGKSCLFCTVGARFCSKRTVALASACSNPAKRVSEAPLTVRPAITLHSVHRRKRVVTTGVCDNGGGGGFLTPPCKKKPPPPGGGWGGGGAKLGGQPAHRGRVLLPPPHVQTTRAPVVMFWGFGGNNWETQASTYEISYLSGRISDENSTAGSHLA